MKSGRTLSHRLIVHQRGFCWTRKIRNFNWWFALMLVGWFGVGHVARDQTRVVVFLVQTEGKRQSALTFSQSLSNSGGKVTLTGDQSSPGVSKRDSLVWCSDDGSLHCRYSLYDTSSSHCLRKNQSNRNRAVTE